MAVIGFTFDRINIERKKAPKGNIKITHQMNIKSIKEQEVEIEKGKKVLDFTFEFKADYSPNIAEMEFVGRVHYVEEDKKAKEILKEWEKNKKIDPKIMAVIVNMAFHRSLLEALDLSRVINVPPVIPLPILSPKSDKAENYIG